MPDGLLATIHDAVRRIGGRHRVATFNPASNTNQTSVLRLVNPGPNDTEVTIVGIDGAGDSPGTDVSVAIAAGTARTLYAWELELGAPEVTGVLGDGMGKWQLTVASDEPIAVMSLVVSPSGRLSNLSTIPVP